MAKLSPDLPWLTDLMPTEAAVLAKSKYVGYILKCPVRGMNLHQNRTKDQGTIPRIKKPLGVL